MRQKTLPLRKCIEPSSFLNGQSPHNSDHCGRLCNYALFTSYRAQSKLYSTVSSVRTHAIVSSTNYDVKSQQNWRASGSRHIQQQRCYAQDRGSRGGINKDITDFLLEQHGDSEMSEKTESTCRAESKGTSYTSHQENSSENVQSGKRHDTLSRRFNPTATKQDILVRRTIPTRSKPHSRVQDTVTEEQIATAKPAKEGEEKLDTSVIMRCRAVMYRREILVWKKEIQAARNSAITESEPITYESQAIFLPTVKQLDWGRVDRPWASSKHDKESVPPKELLSREITAFSQYIRPTEDQIIERWSIAAYLIEELQKLRPDWTFEVFGSSAAGIATPESDIDIAAHCRDPTNNRWQLLEDIKDLITTAPPRLLKEFRFLDIEPGKYPLMNLKHLRSGLSIQITSGRKVFQQTFLLNCLQRYPHLRNLYYVIRTILDVRHLNKVFHGGIGSYTTLMMIIAYLKRRKHDSADTGADQLLGFLEFYGELDTSKYGISAKTGSLFLKHDFSDKEEKFRLHQAAKRRLVKARCNAWLICERDRFVPWRICVQDGVYDGRDVSQKAYAYKHIAHTFRQCHEYLMQFPQLPHNSPLEMLVGQSVELYFLSRRSLRYQMKHWHSAWSRRRRQIRDQFTRGQHPHQHVWPHVVKPGVVKPGMTAEVKREKSRSRRRGYRTVLLDQARETIDSSADDEGFDMTDEDEQDLTGLEEEDNNAVQSDNEVDSSQHSIHDSLPLDFTDEDEQDLTGLEKEDKTTVQSNDQIDFSEDALHNLLPPDLAKSDFERDNLEVQGMTIENEKEATPAKLEKSDEKV